MKLTAHMMIRTLIQESIDITDRIDVFHEGQNLLAIHGLNQSSSADILFSAAVIGARIVNSDPDITETATEYTSPIILSQDAHIKACTLIGNRKWSTLSGAALGGD